MISIRPDDVHPSHDVIEEGLYVSDPFCQRCRAGVFTCPDRLLVPCDSDGSGEAVETGNTDSIVGNSAGRKASPK